ncbi:MgtC/SapB family protein [Butyrivibrio sp. NC2002]|uniref:MgtC/SapB family protein n=1 Tax=Butyrivibrio sp. NC2002 TaxID=1410610 RepID=UPI00055E8811|nr:MgtC/SapB family protein [Butyrivibrio sp. NC2002]
MNIIKIYEYIGSMDDIAVAIRLILALIFGSLVGWERIYTRHSAGIKTFALVSLGAAVATSLNVYLAMMPSLNADVSRIPAGVVSGIGFLGAGTILVTGRKQIKGLTTAASLWVTACMGMALGAGYISVGIICFALIIIANIVLMHLSIAVEEHSKFMSIYVEVEKEDGVSRLSRSINGEGHSISSIKKSKDKTLNSSDVALIVDIVLDKNRSHSEILNSLSTLEFVNYVEEI